MAVACAGCLRREGLRPLSGRLGELYRAAVGVGAGAGVESSRLLCPLCSCALRRHEAWRRGARRAHRLLLAGDWCGSAPSAPSATPASPAPAPLLARSNTLLLEVSCCRVDCRSVAARDVPDTNHCADLVVHFDLKRETPLSDRIELDPDRLVKLERVDDVPSEDPIAVRSVCKADSEDERAERRLSSVPEDSLGEDDNFELGDGAVSEEEPPTEMKKLKKVKDSRQKKRKLNKTLKSNMKKKIKKPEFSSRMVLETEQYKVIKLNRDQLLGEMTANAKSARYLNSPYKCELCVKGFNYEDVLQNHMTKHEQKNGTFECDLCHQFLPSAVSMRGHKKSHSTKYECKRCGVVKASRQHLLEHYMLVHEGSPRTYVCNVCGKTLTKRTMFQKHMRIHYPTNKIPCDKCGKLFKTIETLRAHMLRHDDVKRYACDQCAKTFRYASLLYTHKVTHIKTKDYYCVECDMRFKTESNLRLHLRKSLKHIDPDLLKFQCEQCDRRYDDLKGLQHHVEWVHLRLKNFKCAKCDMQFGSHDGLRSHMKKIHDGIRPPRTHVCEICNKAFRAKAVLVKHIRVHTGERPYECNECGKKFAQNSTMSTHIKLVHLKMQRHVNRKKSTNNSIIIKDSSDGNPNSAVYPTMTENAAYYYPSGSAGSTMREIPSLPVYKFSNDE